MPDSRELLTIKQVAELTGLSRERIQLLCMADRIPSSRESGRRNARYLIRRGDAEALREKSRADKRSLAQSQRRAVARVVPVVTQPVKSQQLNAGKRTDTREDHELLTTRQVAELTGMTYLQVHSLCIHGRIPYVRENDRKSARYLIRRCDAVALRERFEGSAGDGE